MTDAPGSLEEPLRRSLHHVQQRKKEQQGMSSSKAIVRQQPETTSHLPTEWETMRSQADELLQSGFLPKSIRTPEQAVAIMQTGKELGLGPMQSLRGIHVIDGKPAMSADLIAGLALARVPGSTLRVVESTNAVCRVEAGRSGQALTPFSFSMDDAKAAGLTGKPVWRQYPRAMLRARCLTEACRAVFPDVVMGLYSPEELEDSSPGQVVDVQPFRESAWERGDAPALSLSPHSFDRNEDKSSDGGELAVELLKKLEKVKAAVARVDSYDKALALRTIIGTRSEQSDLTRRLQAGKEDGRITADLAGEIDKLWMHCDRQVTKLEEKHKTGPEDALTGDEPDGTEALAPGREPGADEDEDLL